MPGRVGPQKRDYCCAEQYDAAGGFDANEALEWLQQFATNRMRLIHGQAILTGGPTG
jgi:hypothetical protein